MARLVIGHTCWLIVIAIVLIKANESHAAGPSCYQQLASCARDASCIRINDTDYCQCSGGYQGDGFTCAQIDYCGMGVHNCSDNAMCSNNGTATTCACKAGFYQGNLQKCIAVNNCERQPCGKTSASLCYSYPNGHDCGCKSGYNFGNNDCYGKAIALRNHSSTFRKHT
jgi:hypothetical protein